MIDFKKVQFCNNIRSIIAKNPEWASDTILSVNKGVDDALKIMQEDQSKMAALLMLFFLKEKQNFEISKEDKLRAISYLSKYFKMESFL